MIINGLII